MTFKLTVSRHDTTGPLIELTFASGFSVNVPIDPADTPDVAEQLRVAFYAARRLAEEQAPTDDA